MHAALAMQRETWLALCVLALRLKIILVATAYEWGLFNENEYGTLGCI